MNRGDILLVDDDPDLLKLISLRLTSAGYRVRTAESGETALATIAVERPSTVITDLRMPGIDGLQLFEAIHRQHPALPVIILTAHGTIPDAVNATQRGVFGFLTKPFDSQDLLQKVAADTEALGWRACRQRYDGGGMAGRHHHPQRADGGSAAAGEARRRVRCECADLR
jgi:two-component system, NtrC family, response regulator GlrR